MLDFSLVYRKFQSSMEGSQGTVDLTLRKEMKTTVTGLRSIVNIATEDEMVGWHHRLKVHESEQAPGDGEG